MVRELILMSSFKFRTLGAWLGVLPRTLQVPPFLAVGWTCSNAAALAASIQSGPTRRPAREPFAKTPHWGRTIEKKNQRASIAKPKALDSIVRIVSKPREARSW